VRGRENRRRLAATLCATLMLALGLAGAGARAGEGQTAPPRVRALWLRPADDDAASIRSGRPAGFVRLARELWRRGVRSEEAVDYNLTPEILATCDLVVIAGRARRYSQIEARQLTSWVKAGGRVLVLAGFGGPAESPQLGKLTVAFGIRPSADRSTGEPEVIRDWVVHPVTRDVRAATAARGAFLEVQAPAQVLARLEGRPVVAVAEYGRGRVAVLYSYQLWANGPADKAATYAEIDLEDNRKLAYQLFDWLAGR